MTATKPFSILHQGEEVLEWVGIGDREGIVWYVQNYS